MAKKDSTKKVVTAPAATTAQSEPKAATGVQTSYDVEKYAGVKVLNDGHVINVDGKTHVVPGKLKAKIVLG